MLSLKQLAQHYIEYQRTYNKRTSVSSCEHTIRELKRFWGEDKDMSSLSSVDVDGFINYRRVKSLKPVSINKDLRVVKGMLNYGVNSGLLSELKFKIRLLRSPRKKELPLLSREEINKLLFIAKNPYKSMILIAACTGLRLNEVLHLTWGDVRWEERMITVTPKGDWTPKSHQTRAIPVGEKLLLTLQSLRAMSLFQKDGDYVFPTRDGGVKVHNNVCRELQKIWMKAGLYKRGVPTLHHLRHNAASQMLNSGASIETVRQILGHSAITTTALYLHSSDDLKKKAVEAVSF